MIYCPKCGKETKTCSSRETDKGYQRRKKCMDCGAQFKTLEVFDGYSDRKNEKEDWPCQRSEKQ